MHSISGSSLIYPVSSRDGGMQRYKSRRMNRVRHIRGMLEEGSQSSTRCGREVKLELTPMRTKAASVSLRMRTIRLNRDVVSRLDNRAIKYLIVHELANLKLRTVDHGPGFYRLVHLVHTVFDERETKKIDEAVIRALVELHADYRIPPVLLIPSLSRAATTVTHHGNGSDALSSRRNEPNPLHPLTRSKDGDTSSSKSPEMSL